MTRMTIATAAETRYGWWLANSISRYIGTGLVGQKGGEVYQGARGLVILLLLAGVVSAADQKATEADLQKVRGQIADLQKEIRADTNQRDTLAGRLRDAELTVAGARRSLAEVLAERAASSRRREELRAEREGVE